jgi:hypothetical protein
MIIKVLPKPVCVYVYFKIENKTINELKVWKHLDKTFIGRIAKGFDFVGYRFEPKELSIASKTLSNFLKRIAQLFNDFTESKRIEVNAYRNRYNHLSMIATDKNCGYDTTPI